MDYSHSWYLMKHDDDSVFGPIDFEELAEWARNAQVSPLDKVSTDQASWVKAPMIPELHMDWLVEVSPDQFYGPTTVMAIREFLTAGEITHDTRLTNCADGRETTVSELPEFRSAVKRQKEEAEEAEFEPAPIRTSIRVNLQQRIRQLEEALLEERRARETAEAMLDKLEAQIHGR